MFKAILTEEEQGKGVCRVERRVSSQGDPQLPIDSGAAPGKADLGDRERATSMGVPHEFPPSFVKYESNILLFVKPA